MRNRALIRAKMVRSFGAKPGDYVFITNINNLHIVSYNPIQKSKRIKVDKYNNIRFDIKNDSYNVGIFDSNIVVG